MDGRDDGTKFMQGLAHDKELRDGPKGQISDEGLFYTPGKVRIANLLAKVQYLPVFCFLSFVLYLVIVQEGTPYLLPFIYIMMFTGFLAIASVWIRKVLVEDINQNAAIRKQRADSADVLAEFRHKKETVGHPFSGFDNQ